MIWRVEPQVQSFNWYKLLIHLSAALLTTVQILQRFSDTWRSPIRKAALWAVITFFDSNRTFFGESNDERRNWAVEALDEQKFTYGLVKPVKVKGVGKTTVSSPSVHYRFISSCSLAHNLDQATPIPK